MSDKTELKRLAEAHDQKDIADPIESKRVMLVEPAVVLALIAENEALTARVDVMHEDRVEAVAELVVQGLEVDQLKAAIATPESVFINLKARKIPKPSLRSMIDLYGEVVNGEDALLLEIAKLRAERDQLKAENEALVSAMNDILRVTPMGVEAFGLAALVLGELSAAAIGKGEQS